MAGIISNKGKILDVVDRQMADSATSLYSIDVLFGRGFDGSRNGMIVVYQQHILNPEESLGEYDFMKNKKVKDVIDKAAERAKDQTEVMIGEPLQFSQSKGRWIDWAIHEALRQYDERSGAARITVKCPPLHIKETRSSAEVARLRGNIPELFTVLKDMDRLLVEGYHYDPWTKSIRKGPISAEMSKR